MIRKPQYKTARRFGERIFAKTQTQKYAIRAGRKTVVSKRPGGGKTEYGQQFQKKQKVKIIYGVMERQFARYVREAREHDRVNPARGLFRRLETRLDNVVYRLGLAPSRAAARQMVAHGHICVDNTRVNIPSYRVGPGMQISIRNESRANSLFSDISERLQKHTPPEWLNVDGASASATIQALPVNLNSDDTLDMNAVLELYSRA